MEWPTVFELYGEETPNILAVVDLLLSLPAGTSECERGFSQMKIIKTQFRNRLKASTMSMLMTIQLHSKGINDFDPTAAIHMWNNFGPRRRRPAFIRKPQRAQATAHAEGSDEEAEADPLSDMDENEANDSGRD